MDELQRMLDKEAITAVLHGYCRHVDLAHPGEVAALFTVDCLFDYGHGRVFEGREALGALLADRLGAYENTSHHLSNVAVDIDGDEAHAESYIYAFHRSAGGGDAVHVWGRYYDRLVRTDAGWLIAHRRIRSAGSEGFAVPEGQATPFERIDRAPL